MLPPLDHLMLHAEETANLPLKERLRALRLSLQQACQQIESQLSDLENGSLPLSDIEPAAPGGSQARLFESAPAGVNPPRQPLAKAKILAPAATIQIDPLLEKATLEELNAALSQAFAHIAAKRAW